MRHVIFLVILVVLTGLSIYHLHSNQIFALSIDLGIALYALLAWRPWGRRRR